MATDFAKILDKIHADNDELQRVRAQLKEAFEKVERLRDAVESPEVLSRFRLIDVS